MPPQKQPRLQIQLDRVERKLLSELQKSPEFKDLEPYQLAHVLLKDKMFTAVRERLKKPSSVDYIQKAVDYTKAV